MERVYGAINEDKASDKGGESDVEGLSERESVYSGKEFDSSFGISVTGASWVWFKMSVEAQFKASQTWQACILELIGTLCVFFFFFTSIVTTGAENWQTDVFFFFFSYFIS